METYINDDHDRIFFSYEKFVDGESGGEEAVRLANFLEGGLRENALAMVRDREVAEGSEMSVERKDGLMEEAMRGVVKIYDVPCIWKEVFYPEGGGGTLSSSSNNNNLQRRRLQEGEQPYSYSSTIATTWSPTQRPLTPENLASISQMLLELMNRWSRHQRLLNILAGYHRVVNKAYLEATGMLEGAEEESRNQQQQFQQKQQHQQSQTRIDGVGNEQSQSPPQSEAAIINPQPQSQDVVNNPQSPPPQQSEGASMPQPSPKKNFHIIQASPPHTASTVATNWLMGLLQPNADFAFMENWPEVPIRQGGVDTTIDSHVVTKTHDLDLLSLYKKTRPIFDEVFFVVSFRGDDPSTRVNEELCQFKNVLCIEYEELIFTNRKELEEMIHRLTGKLKQRFEFFFGPDWLRDQDELNARYRLEKMAKTKTEMTNETHDKIDIKFGVHGGQRIDKDNQHRRLSVALPDGGCEITWPQPAKASVQKAYAASYPGCGARMSWNLIEALTGLWTGDDWDNNHRGKRVVTVKTHFPHDAGHLVNMSLCVFLLHGHFSLRLTHFCRLLVRFYRWSGTTKSTVH